MNPCIHCGRDLFESEDPRRPVAIDGSSTCDFNPTMHYPRHTPEEN